MENPLLTICCTVYNQEKYVEQTLDGFLLQKTNFLVEILIHDDASTDNTQEIIKEYSKKDSRIKLILQTENKYSQNILPWPHYCFPQAKGKYIALCEGDDYWIDPYKLQKQVDFLETNPDYVVSWTDYNILKNEIIEKNNFGYNADAVTIDFDTLFSPYSTLTLTVVFKKEALDMKVYKRLEHSKDNSLYVMLLQKGKGVFFNFVSAVYRIHVGGIYSLKSSYFKNYSSYLNIKEVMELIPEANTKNMNKVLKSLGNAAAFEVLRIKQQGEDVTQDQLDFMLQYFSNANIKTKIKYYKRKLLKQTFKK